MRGLMFVDVPLEVWTRLLSFICFGNYFYINTKIHKSILAQLVSDLRNKKIGGNIAGYPSNNLLN